MSSQHFPDCDRVKFSPPENFPGGFILPSVVVSGCVPIEVLTSQRWPSATISQFAGSAERASTQASVREDRRIDEPPQGDRPWLAQQIEAVSPEIWTMVEQLPHTALEIVPRIESAQLSPRYCAAIADMMHRPIVACRREAVVAGLARAWGELFRERLACVWSVLELDANALSMSLVLRGVPPTEVSGWAEIRGGMLRVIATWGLPQILETATISPDRFEIDLTAATVRVRRAGDKYRRFDLAANLSLQPLQERPVSVERQAEFSLTKTDLAALARVARAIAARSDVRGDVRFEWSLGKRLEKIEDAPNSPPDGRVFYVRDIQPVALARPSAWFVASPPESARELAAEPASEWRGKGASRGQAIAPAFVWTNARDRAHEMPNPGDIWVCQSVPPDRLAALQHAGGLIVEAVSTTSHAILLARDLGLPIVVGAAGLVQAVQTGEWLEMNATVGWVRRATDPANAVAISADVATTNVATTDSATIDPDSQAATHLAASIAASESQRQQRVARRTVLRASLSHLDRASYLPAGLDGIGILRAEMLAFAAGRAIDDRDGELRAWVRAQLEVAAVQCGERPILYRAFERFTPEASLGERGMALYFQHPNLFDRQLEAIVDLHRRGQTQIRLLLPFVRERRELEFCFERLESLEAIAPQCEIEVWIMAEVPSALLALADYCQMGIAGIAIGANDLAALLFGVDRDDPRQTQAASRAHLHRAIASLAAIAKANGLPCQLCDDEIARNPAALRLLLEAGVTALCVSVDRLDEADRGIAVAERTSQLLRRL